MIRYILILIICLALSPILASANDKLAIVTNANSDITSINPKELRRLYLGLRVAKNSKQLSAIRNHSDEILHEAFLQKVMFMSSRTYERQLNLRTIRKGLKPPSIISTQKGVLSAITQASNGIAYMWKTQAENNPDIRILETR